MSRRPEALALEELVTAAEGYLATTPVNEVTIPKCRLVLAMNAARNALHTGKVLDGIASDPADIARGHVGSVG